MGFKQWLEAVDREFIRRFRIDHVLGGFDEDEMVSDWKRGEAPEDWVARIGAKYDLDEYDDAGLFGGRI